MDTSQALTAFSIGLFGGGHCAAMCGGIVLAVESTGRARGLARGEFVLQRVSPYDMMGRLLIMHLGRICAYATLGLLIAWLGGLVWQQRIMGMQTLLKLLANTLMAVFALLILLNALPRLRWNGLERLSLSLWQAMRARFGRHARALFPPERLWQRFAVGYLWGLLPCGLVYAALALALLTPTAADGARTMFLFGLGTIPSLMLLSGAGSWMQRMAQRRDVRIGLGVVILAFALWGSYRAVVPGEHHHAAQSATDAAEAAQTSNPPHDSAMPPMPQHMHNMQQP